MKKKLLCLLFTVLLILSMAAGCAKDSDTDSDETSSLAAAESIPTETADAESKETADTIAFTPGKYTGTAEGHNGTLEVEVEFSQDAILAINIVSSEETEHLTKLVFENIPAQVIKEQSLTVDSITGATVSSAALKSAIADAVTKADGDPDLLEKTSDDKTASETVELNADVVVVGGGAAGMSAALAAEQNGLSVILLEKTAMLGGHAALSGGYVLATGSEVQKNLGVTDDTIESVYEDNWINGGEKSIPELLMLYCENMGAATDWTVDYVQAEIPDSLTKLSENAIDRALVYTGAGKGLSDALEAKIEKTTIDLYLDTTAKTLLTKDEEVTGVKAEAKDGTTYIITAKATVLATGGYGARSDLSPKTLENFVYYGAALASGDGLEMGQAIGADTVNMGYVELFENGVEWKPGIAKSTYNGSMAAWDVSGILVDRNGNRVVNERGPGSAIVEQQAAQSDSTLFLLMDQATFDNFRENIGGTGISQEMLDSWLEENGSTNPIFAHGETIEEAAQIAGIDADELKQTITTYNQYVENGVDEDFGRDAEYMSAKISEEGPYYLVEQKPRYATTLGGLLINTDLQVVNTDGEGITGLYAIGDTAGGILGDDSVPGADVGWAVTSGYVIGQNLVNLISEE